MAVSIDSNTPYSTVFTAQMAANAVYMTAQDLVLGRVLAVVYKADPCGTRLSVILIGAHGTSGYVDITVDSSSRYVGACRGLAAAHYSSPTRRALAIAVLRTYATMDRPLRNALLKRALKEKYSETNSVLRYCDEACAGSLGSRFRIVHGKFPKSIGTRIIDSGLLTIKRVKSDVLDVVYEDSDLTIEQNNDLVYLLGSQLEQLFDPLSEYSPEPTETLYEPPSNSLSTLEDEDRTVQEICEELYMLQSHVRNDLIDFLQNFLIPVRIKVLNNEIENMTIAKLNIFFPPTIDEMFRVNNLFYDALQQALPYGPFEILKACGTTIPYFYRACMRHEAATKNFSRNAIPINSALQAEIDAYSPQRIELVIHSSLHLTKIKLILDRLISTHTWPRESKQLVDEYYQVAVGTIDSFGKEKAVLGHYNKRSFTPTGKLLVEIAQGWPTDLEYGWVNRRVVTIFDAIDILETNSSRQKLHQIVIVFTDAVLIVEPESPIPTTSLSGLHMPSIGDMLMHAMINEAPLDTNLPTLKVVAWSPILNVHFSSFGPKSLMISTQPTTFSMGSTNYSDKQIFTKLYKLVRPDHLADKFVELLAKAKVTTKTQPFHLFKVTNQDQMFYSTVHEIQGYNNELNRCPVAVFLTSNIDKLSFNESSLYGGVTVHFAQDDQHIVVETFSKLNYQNKKTIPRNELCSHIVDEVSYLETLSMSSQNAEFLEYTIQSNNEVVEKLMEWAQCPEQKTKVGHRRVIPVTWVANNKMDDGHDRHASLVSNVYNHNPHSFSESVPSLDLENESNPTSALDFELGESHNIASGSVQQSESSEPKLRALTLEPRDEVQHLRKKDNFNVERQRSTTSKRSLDAVPDIGFVAKSLPKNRPPSVPESLLTLRLPSCETESIVYEHHSKSDRSSDVESSIWESIAQNGEDHAFSSTEEAEQRDVDEWYNNLSHHDAQSLSTELSDVQSEYNFLPSKDFDPSIQVGVYLSREDSHLYNTRAGRAFAPIDLTRENSTVSTTSYATTTASSVNEEFGYLADLVIDDEKATSQSTSGKLYPDLRDTSLVRLGSFILSNEKPNEAAESLHAASTKHLQRPAYGCTKDYLDSEAPTPTLDNLQAVLNSVEEEPVGNETTHVLPRVTFPMSESLSSFQQLLMSSSLNTLQLATLTVQMDEYASHCDLRTNRELMNIKQGMCHVYQQTQVLTHSLRGDNPRARIDDIAARERVVRRQVTCLVFCLAGLGCVELVRPLLEIETMRRETLLEEVGHELQARFWAL